MNEPPFPSTTASQTPAQSCRTTKKTAAPKNPENSGSTPTLRLDKPVLARGGLVLLFAQREHSARTALGAPPLDRESGRTVL